MEVNSWPDIDSLDVQRLHNALLDYDHEYNPYYMRSNDLKIIKCLCNIFGDTNHCQVIEYKFELRVCGD